LCKRAGAQNPAGLPTRAAPGELINRHVAAMGIPCETGRARGAPQLEGFSWPGATVKNASEGDGEEGCPADGSGRADYLTHETARPAVAGDGRPMGAATRVRPTGAATRGTA